MLSRTIQHLPPLPGVNQCSAGDFSGAELRRQRDAPKCSRDLASPSGPRHFCRRGTAGRSVFSARRKRRSDERWRHRLPAVPPLLADSGRIGAPRARLHPGKV